MTDNSYQHWQSSLDQDRILWLTIDRRDASVNSLNQDVLRELASILSDIQTELPAGVIISSGKSKGFIAGADIKQFTAVKTTDEAFELVRQAQIIFDQLNQLAVPTVAMIRGFCLGGGLELALACRYRVAEEGPATRLGLPEVKLGLHPGWGGTVRLPRLIGAPRAMQMMLSGQPVSAAKAARWGIVDVAVPERHLLQAARFYALQHPPVHLLRGLACWSNAAWVRPWLGRLFRYKLAKKVKPEHYPAPFAIIDNWIRDGAQGEQAMVNEARSIAQLMLGHTSRALVRAFFLQDRLKAFAKNIRFKPKHIHVIGAGIMGGDIAAWCAYKGFNVTLQGQSPQKIAPALARAKQLFTKNLQQPRLIQTAFDRLQPDVAGWGLARADIVIEAMSEDLVAKREIFRSIEPQVAAHALLATNTSSLPLAEIASALSQPQRLIGLHFLNPVAEMSLVEVIGLEQVPAGTLQQAAGFINQLGCYPLAVASRPGFLINRILLPYLLEAITLYEEGVPIAVIDLAAKDFGMSMGPIELADKVGLDICLSVAEYLAPYYGLKVPEKLATMVAQQQLGLKTGGGFYRYTQEDRPIIHKAAPFPAPDIADRLILRLCNEAVACWGEKVVADTDLLDAGMIYGIGFAPFRGGPMEYIRNAGVKVVQEKLLRFSERYGERFAPCPQWQEFPERGERV